LAIRQFLFQQSGAKIHTQTRGHITSHPPTLASSAQNYELYSKCNEILLFALGDVATRVPSFSLTGFTSAKKNNHSNFLKDFY